MDADYGDVAGSSAKALSFSDGVRMASQNMITLEATSGTIDVLGALTLTAGSGVVLLNDQLSKGSGKPVVIDADFEAPHDDGTLTIGWSKSLVTNGGDLTITCWDFDLETNGNAFINASTGGMTLHASQSGQTIGLGRFTKNMHVSVDELSYISSASLEIGSDLNGNILVAEITDSSSDSIGTLTLIATAAGNEVSFETYHSSFNKGITVQAMDGIIVPFSSIAGPAVITRSSPTTLSTGTGWLQLQVNTHLSTTNQELRITTTDMQIIGTITSGTASMEVNCFNDPRPNANPPAMNVGDLSGGLALDNQEVQKLSATGIRLGGPYCGDITVSSLTRAHTANLASITTLIASNTGKQVNFIGNSLLSVAVV